MEKGEINQKGAKTPLESIGAGASVSRKGQTAPSDSRGESVRPERSGIREKQDKPYLRAQKIKMTGMQDRRRKLTKADKQKIREIYKGGNIGCRPLARMFGVSRSLIRMIVIPEVAEKIRARFKEHWREYYKRYGKNYHAASMRKTRNYKYSLYKEGKLQDKRKKTEN